MDSGHTTHSRHVGVLSVNDAQYHHQQPTSTTINSHLNHNLPLLLSTRAQFLSLTTHVANCPYTGQVVNTWPSIVNSSKVVLSTRGKLSKSVLRIQMIKSHMFGKFRQVHIQDSTVWEHGRGDTVVTTRSCSQQCWLLQLFWSLI